jgi:hypothetical protein
MALVQGRANVNVMMATRRNHAMNAMKDFIKIKTTLLNLAALVSWSRNKPQLGH